MWGSARTDPASSRRADWTREEYKFMKEFYDATGGSAPDCYRAILAADAKVHAVFHPHHMDKIDRLPHAYYKVVRGEIPFDL